jgi:hypothetical protein
MFKFANKIIIFLLLLFFSSWVYSCDATCCTGECPPYTNVTTCTGTNYTFFTAPQAGCYRVNNTCENGDCYLQSECGTTWPGDETVGCSAYTCDYGSFSYVIALHAGWSFPVGSTISRSGDPACLIAGICNTTTIDFESPPIDGICGTPQLDCPGDVPDDWELCPSGTLANFDENVLEYTWQCIGSCGGEDVNCSVAKNMGTPTSGECNPYYPLNSSEPCGYNYTGIPAPDIPEGSWLDWICPGENCGADAYCSVYIPTNAHCGPAAKTYLDNNVFPDGALCDPGQESFVGASSPVAPVCEPNSGMTIQLPINAEWYCLSQDGGNSSDLCVASRETTPINGACGEEVGECLSGGVGSIYMEEYPMGCQRIWTWNCLGQGCMSSPAGCSFTEPLDPCPPFCGNGMCESGEDCGGCPSDCGMCGGYPVCGMSEFTCYVGMPQDYSSGMGWSYWNCVNQYGSVPCYYYGSFGASCGEAAKIYSRDETFLFGQECGWGSTFSSYSYTGYCEESNGCLSSSPGFPFVGSSMYWLCYPWFGGSSVTCEAYRQAGCLGPIDSNSHIIMGEDYMLAHDWYRTLVEDYEHSTMDKCEYVCNTDFIKDGNTCVNSTQGTCGDNECTFGEVCGECPECSPCCGDGVQDIGETCETCRVDSIGCPPVCGDGFKDVNENCYNCPLDAGCALGQICIDEVCVIPHPVDSNCGNGVIDVGETCANCPADIKCEYGQKCIMGLCTSANSIKKFSLFIDNNKLYASVKCEFDSDANFVVLNDSNVVARFSGDCNSIEKNVLLGPAITGGINYGASIKINPVCDVCTREDFLTLNLNRQETQIPDNSLIALIIIISLVVFILHNKKTNN